MKLGAVILNWNSWRDTISSASSVLAANDSNNSDVFVVDNASSDDSYDRLSEWRSSLVPDERARIRLIRSDRNLGYAGGNNVGISAALQAGVDAVWVINCDVVVAPDALDLVASCAAAHPEWAVIGCLVLDHGSTSRVQCVGGGRFNWVIGRARPVCAGLRVDAVPSPPPALDYVVGAAMFIHRRTIDRIGLLSDHYFLYCEEVDYAERCKRAGLSIGVCTHAKVWHRQGGTTGSTKDLRTRSTLSAYYASRSALLVVRRFHRVFLPTALVARLAYACAALLIGRPDLFLAVARGALSGTISRVPADPR